MNRSIATVTLGGTLPAKFDAIAAAGFRNVELTYGDLEAFAGTAQDVRRLADSYGLKIIVFQPFRDFEGGPRADFAHQLQRARDILETTRVLGAELLLLCSTVAENAIGDEDVHTTDLRALADLAAAAGIRIGYESLSWGKFARRYQDAWRTVERVNRPNFGLVLDTFHSIALGDNLSLLDHIPADRIFLIQVADAPYLSGDIIQWSRHHRCLPGEGEFDLIGFLAGPMRNGYSGPLSLEVFSDQHGTENPTAVAMRGYRSLCKLEYDTRKSLAQEYRRLVS